MVAKSYQSMIQLGDPFMSKGKAYVEIKNPNTGTVRTVRWYTEEEYYKMYPEETKPAADRVLRTQKSVLGFDKGYITIFKGDTYKYLEWFQDSIARYTRCWGWYIISTDELPEDIPEELTPIQLPWELVGNEDETLKAEHIVTQRVEELLYDAGISEFVGEIGERITVTVTVTHTRSIDGYYGHSTAHTMEDENGNIYSWITSAKNWSVGTVKTLRGSVKEHKVYKNQKLTILTRCTECN